MREDIVILGGGHNGLVAAAYLAKAGLRTRVFERRPVLGGACVTEERWPGFQVSRAAYVAGLLRPAVIRELGLERRGLRLLRRNPSSITPLSDGRSLVLGADMAAARASIAQFSTRDAERYPQYVELLEGLARALEPSLDRAPPNPWRLRDAPCLLRTGFSLARLGARDGPRALSLLLGAARPVLESWFESEPLLGTLATDALIGAWASPSSPGTGYVLFHHVMGETNGERGVWAYVEGGMGALSEALAHAACEAGAKIEVDQPVKSILVRDGRAVGVLLEDGREIEAGAVVSNADPQRTFLQLVGRDNLEPEFAREIDALDFRSPVLKLNLALDCAPKFTAIPAGQETGTIHLGAQTLDELEVSFQAAARGALPENPMLELTLASTLDRTLAPPGKHVASLFVQHVPYAIQGSSWEAERDRFADRILKTVDQYAPGFSESVLHREVLAPPDFEREFGLTGGNIFHGAMSLERLLFLRPVPGWSEYAMPLQGLYLCGAGTHPGGGVMGACGRNAAKRILRDAGR